MLSVGFAAGCSTYANKTVGPDGQAALVLRCKTPAHCFNRAGKECPRGYERLDQQNRFPGGTVTNSGYDDGREKDQSSWLIRCKQ
ncbi:MAG: hypothetical protein ACI9OJ_005943 [Myxococcota bacterium]